MPLGTIPLCVFLMHSGHERLAQKCRSFCTIKRSLMTGSERINLIVPVTAIKDIIINLSIVYANGETNLLYLSDN